MKVHVDRVARWAAAAGLMVCAALSPASAKDVKSKDVNKDVKDPPTTTSAPAAHSLKGRIVASDVSIEVPVSSLQSDDGLAAALGGAEQHPRAIAGCCDGAWRVHLAAVLERPAESDTLSLAFRDKGAPDPMFSSM